MVSPVRSADELRIDMNSPHMLMRERIRWPTGLRSSRQWRRRARLGVRADAKDRHRLGSFEPGNPLVVALKDYKNQRGRIDGNCAAMAPRTKGTAVAMMMRVWAGSVRASEEDVISAQMDAI